MAQSGIINSTNGFVFTSIMTGDKSVTLQWAYGGYIVESKIIKIMVLMNDTTVSGTSVPGNLSWTAKDLDFSAIALKNTTITGLTAGEDMLFYLAVVINNNGTIETKYSSLSSTITIVSAPVAFSLPIYDGRDLTREGIYNIKVQYDGLTNPLPDKIVFVLLANSATPTNVVYEFTQNLTNYTSSDNTEIFELSNLSQDLTYEITGFLIKNGLTSPLSNTRWIIATQKTTAPTKPILTFDYNAGTVDIATTIEFGGVHSDTDIQLYTYSDEINLYSESIGTQLYGANMDQENFPFDYTHTFNNSTFTYATSYRVLYRTYNSIGLTSILPINISDIFYLLRTPESPIIQSCDSGDKYINFIWANQDLYGSTPTKYQLSIDNGAAQDITSFSSPDVNGYISLTSNITKLADNSDLVNGTTYHVKLRVVVPDLNDPGQYLYSEWSESQEVTPYTTPDALTLSVSYAEADVNGKAVLSWTIPAVGSGTGYMTIRDFLIRRSYENGDYEDLVVLSNTTNTYTDAPLANGATYKYKIYLRIDKINYNNTQIINSADSNEATIIPWSIPLPPTIALNNTGYAAVGNHYVKITITDRNWNSTSGLHINSDNLPKYKIYVDDLLFATITADNETSTNYKINNITNDVLHSIKVIGSYLDPNVALLYNDTADSNTLTETPFYTDTLFTPQTVTVTNVGSNTATINWLAPTLLDSLSTYNLELLNYRINIYEHTDLSVSVLETTVDTNTLTHTYANELDLVNGKTYIAKVTATYDRNINEAGNQIVYSSASSGNFTPFTTYALSDFTLTSVGSGEASFSWTQDTGSNNNNEIYYTEYSIIVNGGTSVNREVIVSYDAVTNTHTATVTGLTNGTTYSIKISPKFIDPNTGTALYNYTSTVNATPYAVPAARVLEQSNLDNNSVQLSWDAANMSGLPFKYVIYWVDNTINQIVVNSDVSSYIFNENLVLGHNYSATIKVRFSDPNSLLGDSPDYYVYNDESNTVNVTPFEQPTVGNLSGVAGNQQVVLTYQIDTDGFEGGLQISDYEYGYKLSTDSNYTYVSLGLVTSPNTVTVTELTNGSLYDFVYRVKTDNSVNPSEYGTTLTSQNSNMISLKPFTNPSAPTDVTTDTASGSNVVLSWTAPSDLGGMPLYGYDVYENNSLISSVDSNTTSITFEDRTYGQTYTYYVVAKTQNTNLSPLTLVSSADSSNASKVVFEAPHAVSELEVISVVDATTDTVTFQSTYTLATGLLNPQFKIVYNYVGSTSPSNIVYVDVANATIVGGKYRYSITDFIGGKTYTAYVSVVGTNPNVNADILESSNSYVSFGSFDNPVINEFYITEKGDRYISVTISSKLNFTVFEHYRLEFYDNADTLGPLIGTVFLNNASFSTATGDRIASVVNHRIEKFDTWPEPVGQNLHGVLDNNVDYNIVAYSVSSDPTNSNIDIESNAMTISSVSPAISLVPEVESVSISGSVASVVVDSRGMDILGYRLILLPFTTANDSDVWYYKSNTTIPVNITDENKTIDIQLQVHNTTLGSITGVLVNVKNNNGWSELFEQNLNNHSILYANGN